MLHGAIAELQVFCMRTEKEEAGKHSDRKETMATLKTQQSARNNFVPLPGATAVADQEVLRPYYGDRIPPAIDLTHTSRGDKIDLWFLADDRRQQFFEEKGWIFPNPYPGLDNLFLSKEDLSNCLDFSDGIGNEK